MLSRTPILLAFIFLFSCGFEAQAQRRGRRPPLNPIETIGADRGSPDAPQRGMSAPEEEMMAERAIRVAVKEREENLARAREAAQLGTELRDTYLKNSSLGREDLKKLERLEKLTRRIRSEAGGSDDADETEKVPQQLEPALARVAQLSDEMRKGVENTPRQVISMSVIEHANQLLDVIRQVRTLTK